MVRRARHRRRCPARPVGLGEDPPLMVRGAFAVAFGGLLLAGAPRAAAPQGIANAHTAWLHAPTPAAAEALLERQLAALRPEDQHAYLLAVGSALGAPEKLPRPADRRAVLAHLPVL